MAGGDPLGPHPEAGALTEAGAGPADAAETLLGHVFARPALLREALTHRSAVSGPRLAHGRLGRSTGRGSNERLEFVGDRVLGLLMAEWLAERYPHEQEGQLGPRLAHLVSQPVIAGIAEALGLPALLQVAPGESRAGVRGRATVLADATEALIGALYYDGGLEAARRFVRRIWTGPVEAAGAPPKDAKTTLQEWLLARGRPLPAYRELSREGPDHAPRFTVGVQAGTDEASAIGATKREAERLAAEALLRMLA